jgi:translation initiation factor 3 subunit L
LIANSKDEDFLITPQWIYDITQEFAYQFQGFCQYRCQLGNLNPETVKMLQANRDAWNLSDVSSMLNRFIKLANLKSSTSTSTNTSNVRYQFGYFAAIELARIQCLIADYNTSLSTIAHLRLFDYRNELFVSLPICHFNVFYHIGVCYMMLRRWNESLDVFSEIILYVLRILKPGASSSFRPGVPQQLQRMVDKAMSLTGILMTITPSYRIDDSIKEAIENKVLEKIRRLSNGDRSSASELFETSCPKFISPLVPDYGLTVNMHQVVFNHQSTIIVDEIMQFIPFLKLRSFLSMYASIDVSKLSRFTEIPEIDLICLLLSYKNKAAQSRLTGSSSGSKSSRAGNDLNFRIDGGVLLIDTPSAKNDQVLMRERYFVSNVRKHHEIKSQINKTFSKLGL